MVKNLFFIIVALAAFAISFVMFILGSTSTHLTELKSLWYLPIPIGFIFLIIGVVGLVKGMSASKLSK